MRFNTEDLLTLRDGEPIDADRRARALADPDRIGEIARLERVQGALRALPELDPPEGVWERIAARLDAPSSSRAGAAAHDRRASTRAAAAAAVAAVGLVALAASIVGHRADGPTSPSAPTQDTRTARDIRGREAASTEALPTEALPTEAPRMLDDRSGSAELAASRGATSSATSVPSVTATSSWAPPSRMAAESARLERLLAWQVRFQPEVMNAGTAGTIASLEDTLAALDEQLTFAAAGGLEPPERETLWRERVNVMRALVQVRYAQAQRTGL